MAAVYKEVMYVDSIDKEGPFFLSADIGGTNSNFGIFYMKSQVPLLVLSLHYKSQKIEDFTVFMKELTTYLSDNYAIECLQGCIGASGIVYPARVSVQPTNLTFEINTHEIMKITSLKELFLINDFEAVALGIELINPKDLIILNKGVHRLHANMGFIGAGTGLGKSMSIWQTDNRRYFPVASEGGHADIPLYNADEWAIANYIYKNYGECPVSWEMLLSGSGIQKIYHFLGTQREYPVTDITREIEIHDFSPDRISSYAQKDERCKDTFEFYIRLYARCAKNFVLEGLTLNGLYIAGGIAAKNIGMFSDPLFMQEFIRCGKQSRHLATIPLFIIADYNVSLYGAVLAARLRRALLF
ncbi:glucokinase [Candidatus Dependentiae bacterium]|nr:glucokinase [Candidatus Dependentiae bacterium]